MGKNYISEDKFRFLLNIVRQMKMDHQLGYDAMNDDSYLRIDHGDMHMMFHVQSVNVALAND